MSSDPVAAFLAAIAPTRRDQAAAQADLSERLSELLYAARSAWPGIDIADADFAAHLGARLAAGDDSASLPSEPRAADLYIACACSRGDGLAIAAFQKRYFGEIDMAGRRTGAPDGLTAEARQNVARALFTGPSPAIGRYAGRGDLRGWIRVTAIREVIHLVERARREIPVGDAVVLESLSPAADPELSFLKGRYRAEFEDAFRSAFAALSERERGLFKRQLLDGWGIDEFAAHHGTHRSTAARWLAAARRALLDGTRERLKERWGATTLEVDSVVRLLRSRLDVSLEQVLRTR